MRLQRLPLQGEEEEELQKRFLVKDASPFAEDGEEGVKVEEREKRKGRVLTWRLRSDKQLRLIVHLREREGSIGEGTLIGKAFQ